MKRGDNLKVFLNPGHDSKRTACGCAVDCGAENKEHELYECDYVRILSDSIRQVLYENGYQVQVMQDDCLSGVCNEANLARSDVFVSIHCNACVTHRGRGTEVWCYHESRKGHMLAENILKGIMDMSIEGLWNRGVKTDDGSHYGVLIKTNMPAVIVECAFIDNEDDYNILIDNIDEFAKGIANGIMQYLITGGD